MTRDDLITTQKILAKSMLRPDPNQGSSSSPGEKHPRVPLHTLDESAACLLLAYLGFARYSHLLLSAGVTGMDLVTSKDEDLECLGIGFRPHRQRLLKAIKATRHAGVNMAKLGLLGELEEAVNASPPVFLDVMTFHKRRSPSPSSPLSWDFQVRAEQNARHAGEIERVTLFSAANSEVVPNSSQLPSLSKRTGDVINRGQHIGMGRGIERRRRKCKTGHSKSSLCSDSEKLLRGARICGSTEKSKRRGEPQRVAKQLAENTTPFLKSSIQIHHALFLL